MINSARYSKKYSIGLTGGIGAGKSVVADFFIEFGITVIDADKISRQITASNGVAIEKIAATFGGEYITDDNALDRAKIAALIFNNNDKKSLFENIMHPIIRQQSEKEAASAESEYIIFDIPLLFETEKKAAFDRVLSIISPAETRIERVLKRSTEARKITRELVLNVMKNQVDEATHRKYADDIIENNAGLENIKLRCIALHQFYLAQVSK